MSGTVFTNNLNFEFLHEFYRTIGYADFKKIEETILELFLKLDNL